LQDTGYIKYAEQERNASNNRITVKYPAISSQYTEKIYEIATEITLFGHEGKCTC
jgi:hypothetical protein